MRKLTLLFAVLLMASTQIFAAEIVLDGITYNINTENNTASVASADIMTGITQLVIPDKVEYNSAEYPITSIGNYAFADNSSLTSVTIGNSVTSIGDFAFANNSSLASVTFGNSVTTIGDAAFNYCKSLASVTFPASVTSIGDYAFRSCTKLAAVTFEGNLCQNNIGDNAFSGIDVRKGIAYYLTLPDSWGVAYLPIDSNTPWHGGCFFSNRYYSLDAYKEEVIAIIDAEAAKVTDWSDNFIDNGKIAITEAQTKTDIDAVVSTVLDYIAQRIAQHEALKEVIEAALAEIDATMGDFSESEYLLSLIATEINAINTALDEATITNNKTAAINKLSPVMAIIDEFSPEIEAKLHGDMADECNDCPAVTISNGTTTIKLYNPQSVSFSRERSTPN